MKGLFLKFVSFLLLIIFISPALDNQAYAAKKRHKKAKTHRTHKVQEVVTHIPVEVIDALKLGTLDDAIRTMKMEATSPRSKFILREMERANDFEKDKAAKKDHRELFNTGVAYHNLFLFLQGHDFVNKGFYDKALKYYKKACQTKSPSRKNNILLTEAALHASFGDTKMAGKVFSKVDPNLFEDDFVKFEAMALYYAAAGDIDNTITNLESAYKLRPDFIKFWLGICDDFIKIAGDERFQSLMKKWNVKILNRGPLVYSPDSEDASH